MKTRKIIVTALLGVVFTTMGLPGGQVEAFATANIPSNVSVIEKQEDASVYAAKTEWKYRTKDGKLQRRLWSTTEQKWLTAWQNV